MASFKKKSSKTAKGYRLKPSTHKLIIKLSKMMEADHDEVISKSCNRFFREVKQIINKKTSNQGLVINNIK